MAAHKKKKSFLGNRKNILPEAEEHNYNGVGERARKKCVPTIKCEKPGSNLVENMEMEGDFCRNFRGRVLGNNNW